MKKPQPRTVTLDNGLRLVIVDGAYDDVNRLTVVARGGMAEARAPFLPGLVAATLNEGAADRPAADVAEALDYNGSWFLPAAHRHHTSATIFSLNRRFAHVLPVFADMLMRPAFSQREVDVAIEMAARKLEVARAKVDHHAMAEMKKMGMGATSILARDYTPDDLRDTTADDLRAFHASILAPEEMTAFLGGRITPEIEDAVCRTLGEIPSAPPCPIVDSPVSTSTGLRADIAVPGAVQDCVAMVLPAIPRSHPDYIPLRIAVTALGGYFGSRLNANVREDQGLTYGITAALNGSGEGSYISIVAQTDHAYVERLIEATRRELTLMAPQPPTDDELTRLRSHYMTELAANLDSPLSIAEMLVTELVADIPADYFEAQQRILADTTPEAIAVTAERYLRPELLSIAVAGA